MDRSSNLLDEALGVNDGQTSPSATRTGRVVLIEDCVETSGAFVLHHLVKACLSPQSSGVVIFVAFAQPFSHYDRVLRKMGCNLVVQQDNKRFLFLNMLTLECPGENQRISMTAVIRNFTLLQTSASNFVSAGDGEQTCKGGLHELFGKIQKSVEVSALTGVNRNITIIIDDVSLVEVAAKGSSNHVLDFLHYCHTLTTEFGCALVILIHEDIYSSAEHPTFILQMEYLAEVIIKAEPLVTGLATDVHGQLTVMNKGISDGLWSLQSKMRNFHFRVRENGVDYFYPGSRT